MKIKLTTKIAMLLARCLKKKSTTWPKKSWPRVTSVVKAIMSQVFCVIWPQNWRLRQRPVKNRTSRFAKPFWALDWFDSRLFIIKRSLFYTNVLRKFLPFWYFVSFYENRSFSFFSRLCWHCLREFYVHVYSLMSTYCSDRPFDVSFQFLNLSCEF